MNLVEQLGMFQRPTYGAMWLPGSGTVDHELRLYLPRRLEFDLAIKLLRRGEIIAETLCLQHGQLEVNRSGMCLCFSCGPTPREQILEIVNVVRKNQNLKLIML